MASKLEGVSKALLLSKHKQLLDGKGAEAEPQDDSQFRHEVLWSGTSACLQRRLTRFPKELFGLLNQMPQIYNLTPASNWLVLQASLTGMRSI